MSLLMSRINIEDFDLNVKPDDFNCNRIQIVLF